MLVRNRCEAARSRRIAVAEEVYLSVSLEDSDPQAIERLGQLLNYSLIPAEKGRCAVVYWTWKYSRDNETLIEVRNGQ